MLLVTKRADDLEIGDKVMLGSVQAPIDDIGRENALKMYIKVFGLTYVVPAHVTVPTWIQPQE